MKLLSFQTTKRKDGELLLDIGKFYFRDNENLGPLELRLPKIFYTYPVSANMASGIKARLIEKANYSGNDFRTFRYDELRSILQVRAHDDYRPLETAISQPEFQKVFARKPLSGTDWLRLRFDWTQEITLDDRIASALLSQKKAHNILRDIADNYLLEDEINLAKAQDQLREILPSHGAKGFEENLLDVNAELSSKTRVLSAKVRNLSKAYYEGKQNNLPEEVISQLAGLAIAEKEMHEQLAGHSYEMGFNFRELKALLYIKNYSPYDLLFSPILHDEPVLGAFDIETTKYKGSFRNPSGINQEVWLAAINSDNGSINVGTLDIGTDSVKSEKYRMEIPYLRAGGSHSLRRLSSGKIRKLELSILGGQNIDHFDLVRCASPNNDEQVINSLPRKIRAKESLVSHFRSPDGMFRTSSDNSEPYYSGRTEYGPRYRTTVPILDSLTIARNYLSILTRDNKLETIGMLVDFFSDLGLGFEKSMHSYGELEKSVEAAENGDIKAAHDAVLYGCEDNIAQLEITRFFYQIFRNISEKMHIYLDEAMNSSKTSLASSYFNRVMYNRRGQVRNAFDNQPYGDFDVELGKQRALLKALERNSLDSKPKKGLFEASFFFTPYFTEGSDSALASYPELKMLQESVHNSSNVLEKLVIQQILDCCSVQFLADAWYYREKRIDYAEFQSRHKIHPDAFLNNFEKRMDQIAKLFGDGLINYNGNIIAVSPHLEERLKDNKFIHIGNGSLISVSPGSMLFGIKDNEVLISSVGFQILSPKKRFSEDYVTEGFDPNFYQNLIYDLVETYFEKGYEAAKEHLESFQDGFSVMGNKEFFMTLRPGQNIEDYSLRARSTKRFKIIDYLHLGKDQKEVIIMEGEDDILRPVKINPDNPDSWKNLVPYYPFYREYAFSKEKNLYKLVKTLGFEDML
jgi:hypothetical protein